MKNVIAFAVLALGATGCKDNNPQPDVPDARRVDAPAPDVAVDSPASCFAATGTPPNCFREDTCVPTQLTDFLNSCSDSQCIPFDNVARLPLYNNGTLPPLP